jgi:hypothetical protein
MRAGEAARLIPGRFGNVRHNESSGCAILPTPAMAGGLVEDARRTATLSFKRPGEKIC